jgi:hypothetical protein
LADIAYRQAYRVKNEGYWMFRCNPARLGFESFDISSCKQEVGRLTHINQRYRLCDAAFLQPFDKVRCTRRKGAHESPPGWKGKAWRQSGLAVDGFECGG